MKAIEFLRVSTQEQSGDDRAGIPRQKEANASTIEQHNLNIVKTITLTDVSGTSVMHTPEVIELLSRIELGDIVGVVVADWDRLIRLDDFRDFALLQHFKETNTLVFLPDQVIDLNTQSGFLTGGLQSIISGNELTQIKKRMLNAKEIKRKKGEHPNALHTLPLGVSYDYIKRQFYYTEDIYKVKNLFRLFHDKGIHNYRQLERLTYIHHRTIPNLLRNEIYIGYRTYTEKRSNEKSIREDGRQKDKRKVKRQHKEIIRVKVIDEPLIEEAMFQHVQEIIATKNRDYHSKKSPEGARFLYSGFLTCGVCGDRIYSTSGGKNHRRDYYYCRTKNHTYRRHSQKCKSSYMPKELMEYSITSFVKEKLTDVDYLREMILRALSENRNDDIEAEAEYLREKLKKVERKRSKILDPYLDGLFSRQELDRKVSELNNEIVSLKKRLTRIEKSQKLKYNIKTDERIASIVTTLAEFEYWTPVQKRAFLRSQMPNFAVTSRGITGFTLNFCTLGNRMDMDS